MKILLKNGNEYTNVTRIIFGKLSLFFKIGTQGLLQAIDYVDVELVDEHPSLQMADIETTAIDGDVYLAQHFEKK